MNSKRALTEGLLSRLKAAFPLKSTPLSSEIIPASSANYPDSADCEEWLGGKAWDLVEHEYVEKMHMDLSLLTDRAYLYYLPAFLKAAYEAPDGRNAGNLSIQFDPYKFGEPPSAKVIDKDKVSRFKKLTPLQRKEIVAILAWKSKSGSPSGEVHDRVLDWWEKFANE